MDPCAMAPRVPHALTKTTRKSKRQHGIAHATHSFHNADSREVGRWGRQGTLQPEELTFALSISCRFIASCPSSAFRFCFFFCFSSDACIFASFEGEGGPSCRAPEEVVSERNTVAVGYNASFVRRTTSWQPQSLQSRYDAMYGHVWT